MSTQAVDFSDLGGRRVQGAAAQGIDFSDLGGKRVDAGVDAATQATKDVKRPLPQELQPSGFTERVGERIESNVHAIPRMIDTATGAARRDLKSPKAQAEYDTGVAQEAAGVRHMTGQDAAPILGSPTLGRVVGAATIAPRMIYDTVKGWIQDPAAAAGDIATAYIAHQASGGGGKIPADRQPTLRAPAAPPDAAIAPEQAKFTADLDKANAPYVKQLAADELSRQQGEIAGRVQQGTQQLHASVRGTLNQRWDALRGRMQGATVPTQPLTGAIEQSQKMLAGVPDDLKIFKEITHAIDAGGAEDLAGRMTETGVEPAQPGGLAFNDARIQASALGEKWASASGNLRRALKNVYDAYNKQLQATADAAGNGREYQALRDDWHQYVEDWQGRGPLNKVLNAPHQNYVTPQVLGRGSELLQQQLQRYPQGGAVAADVAAMRDVTRQAKIPPLKVVQPPVPLLRKLSGPAKAAVWVGGKLVGGHVAGWPGAVVGGKMATAAAEEMMNRPPRLNIPRTPEEYTRTILAAKEGDIPAGEADRLITRGGGRVGVIRRPSEPTQ